MFPGNAVTFADAYAAAFYASVFATGRVSHFTGTFSHRRPAELAAQADLLRDLFGNPFDPLPPLEASLLNWNTGTVRGLAQAADDERLAPACLGVLADALEEAGGGDARLLGHLRSPGPHVRGCFALDAVLGK